MTHTHSDAGIVYWGDYLFALIMSWIIPVCLIAIIPGIYMSLSSDMPVLAAFNILSFLILIILAFSKKINVSLKKIIFIWIFYTAGVILLYYLGYMGPGILYLYAVNIFSVIIAPEKKSYYSFFIVLAVCILFAVEIHFQWIRPKAFWGFTVDSWIAIASNLIFLSLITTLLIPKIFNGLQKYINSLQDYKNKLNEKQKQLIAANDMLITKNNELEQFAYITSHDLQEPVRMISSFLEKLKIKYKDSFDDKGKQYLFFATQGAYRLKSLIADLYLYIKSGHDNIPKELIDVNVLVQEVKQLLYVAINENKAQIINKQLPLVFTHKAMLLHVIQNLIDNALKYRKPTESPVITVSSNESDIFWQFSVSDNGIGIEQEYFDKIFIIFQRLHSKDEYSGTGVGLAITRKNVENMGGKLWVESVPGKGSTFYFTIKK